jgi:hypothetical protein
MKNINLSPDILFHFTNKKSLFKILESDFKVSYAREKIIGQKQFREYAAPMVSFCDLRVSELKEHMNKYGKYGIGLTKKWANANGLNPVVYVNRYSPFIDGFITGLDEMEFQLIYNSNERNSEKMNNGLIKLSDTYRYLKNYEGELKREGKKVVDNYRFANEREWRYVPPIATSDIHPLIPIDIIKTKEQKKFLNETIEHKRLSYKPDDIRYLIVNTDNEITELIAHLHKSKNVYESHIIDRLASRILTAEQIENDV